MLQLPLLLSNELRFKPSWWLYVPPHTTASWATEQELIIDNLKEVKLWIGEYSTNVSTIYRRQHMAKFCSMKGGRKIHSLALVKCSQFSMWFTNWTPLYLTVISLTRAWISNYIHTKQWEAITHPCLNFNNGSLAKLLLKFVLSHWYNNAVKIDYITTIIPIWPLFHPPILFTRITSALTGICKRYIFHQQFGT